MSRSEATLGGERRESPPPVAPGDGGGTPFSGTLCWRSWESGSASTMGVVASRVPLSTAGEFSSRQGLPGMIPADLAARSIALESWLDAAELDVAGEALDRRGRGGGARRVWIGRNDPVPVAEELERMEKEQTC